MLQYKTKRTERVVSSNGTMELKGRVLSFIIVHATLIKRIVDTVNHFPNIGKTKAT